MMGLGLKWSKNDKSGETHDPIFKGTGSATVPVAPSGVTIITIPVRAVIMAEDLTVEAITVEVLMAVAAGTVDTNFTNFREFNSC